MIAVLRLEPGDADAKKTKLFLLLQTEDYKAALLLIDTDPALYAFERAYSLYRLHQEDEAREILSVLKAEKEDDRGVAHLEAQMVRSYCMHLHRRFLTFPACSTQSYRSGAYQDAFDLYTDLLNTAEPVRHVPPYS